MKLLLLAGTGEARRLAASLACESGVEVVASFSGATREPQDVPVTTISGGFGGRAEFSHWLDAHNINAVVDATHPFAHRISRRATEVCAQKNLPCLHILRPGWVPEAGDNWTMIGDTSEAADHIPPGATVFLATGRQSLPGFENLAGRHLICRQIDPPDAPFPFANGEYLVGRPPFSTDQEIALFRARKVDWLVVKNAGGRASRAKLDAARALKIPVLMLKRPPRPGGPCVADEKDALNWIRGLK